MVPLSRFDLRTMPQGRRHYFCREVKLNAVHAPTCGDKSCDASSLWSSNYVTLHTKCCSAVLRVLCFPHHLPYVVHINQFQDHLLHNNNSEWQLKSPSRSSTLARKSRPLASALGRTRRRKSLRLLSRSRQVTGTLILLACGSIAFFSVRLVADMSKLRY